jgi:hypothetical protein
MVFHRGGRELEIVCVKWIHMGATWPSTIERRRTWRVFHVSWDTDPTDKFTPTRIGTLTVYIPAY